MQFESPQLPPFIATAPLVYDLNEIEHQFYMFDRRCVGCIVLVCTCPIDISVMGTVELSGKKLDGCFLLPLKLPQTGDALSLVVPIRGHVDYAGRYTLRIEGFKTVDGAYIKPMEAELTTREYPTKNPAYAEHDAVAMEAAREGMVLLKNEDGVLPLPQGSTVNLFGEGVTNYRIGTTGAGRINPRFSYGLRDAVRKTSSFKLNLELDQLYTAPVSTTPGKDVLERAKAENDTAFIFITRGTGENIDNAPIPGEYYLSNEEERMIAAVCTVFDKVVVILNTGYPIDMNWTKRHSIKALVYAGLAGQASAEALLEILDGRTNPSGKLPDTWAWDYYDIPASVNFHNRQSNEAPIQSEQNIWLDTCYEEGIYIGYRYFETFGKNVAFPFGHGLSYTSFEVNADSPVDSKNIVLVSVTVYNNGSRPGKEVVTLYVKLPGTSQEQASRQLVGFAKTGMLAPGERETLQIHVPKKYLATCHIQKNAWLIEEGSYEFYVGGSVHEVTPCGKMEIPEAMIVSQLLYHLPSPIEFEELSQKGKQWPDGKYSGIREGETTLTHPLPRCWKTGKRSPSNPCDGLISYDALKNQPTLLEAFVEQMDTATLTRLNMMYGHGWSMDKKGEAGRMAPLEQYGVPEYVCADGNSGVNINAPNIGMPTSVVLCSTFNTALARQVGRVIGEEAAENGIQMILAPGMNIHRNPLNGRHAEYFSEDPYLAGIMAGAQVQGLHDAGVSDSVKHVAGNNCETSRKRNHSLMSERTMREIYLRAFEVLLDQVKPDSIMASYNAMNGSMCASDPVLMEGILRDEFGFDGFLMTDWTSYDTVDMVEAVHAGMSWLTPGENDGSLVAVLDKAVENGSLTRERLRTNAERVFHIMLRRFN